MKVTMTQTDKSWIILKYLNETKTEKLLQSDRVLKVVVHDRIEIMFWNVSFVSAFQSFIVISFRRLEPRSAARAVQKNITSDEDNERQPLLH